MRKSRHEILVYRDEDGRYVAECIDLPGCVSDGRTKKDAIKNIKEAIAAHLESISKHEETCLAIRAPALVTVSV